MFLGMSYLDVARFLDGVEAHNRLNAKRVRFARTMMRLIDGDARGERFPDPGV